MRILIREDENNASKKNSMDANIILYDVEHKHILLASQKM